jgi:hypothetical protein
MKATSGVKFSIPDPKPKTLVNLHFIALLLWTANFPLLLIRGVRESVPYIAFCSVYANWVGHFSGWDAARAEQSNEEN